jgi:hypothetical protein
MELDADGRSPLHCVTASRAKWRDKGAREEAERLDFSNTMKEWWVHHPRREHLRGGGHHEPQPHHRQHAGREYLQLVPFELPKEKMPTQNPIARRLQGTLMAMALALTFAAAPSHAQDGGNPCSDAFGQVCCLGILAGLGCLVGLGQCLSACGISTDEEPNGAAGLPAGTDVAEVPPGAFTIAMRVGAVKSMAF